MGRERLRILMQSVKHQPEAQARDGKQFTIARASGWCKFMNNTN
jgi:hypothetical protein